jgi:single-strand DNA-binding protein
MNDTAITLAGNLVADPELRYTAGGVAVASFRVASTARIKTDEGWKDGDTLFLTVNAWPDLAEHVAESARKGDRVIVTGRLRQRTFEGRDGGKVTVTEIDATDVGVSLQQVSAKFAKAQRSSGNGGGHEDEPLLTEDSEVRFCIWYGEHHERYGPDGRPCTVRLQCGLKPGPGSNRGASGRGPGPPVICGGSCPVQVNFALVSSMT